ncbi:short chain dehydrogenase [Zalerion maritima]|uniref:Short chain dehydrogenase n=1 Tax=Zalerion maritima TaxID=339359 RepID=A0AAD5RI51_9PEZI|nr:short chain dehydrogenase [Zalerion maritima]
MTAPTGLAGTTALVTGGAAGLGRAIAQAYLAAGANVVICDVDRDRLDAATSEWGGSSSSPSRFLAVQADVSSESSVSGLIAAALSAFPSLDVVVNNAGIMDRFDPVGACPKSLWDSVLSVNLTGPYLVSKAAINHWESAAAAAAPGPGSLSGIIVNIGSNASFMGMSAGAAYTASKHGILALTKNTAGFYGAKGIYSMALLLGGMDATKIADAFVEGMNQEAWAKINAVHPGFVPEKTGVPLADVAKYVLFLSDRGVAASANGSCIPFNKNWPEA